MILLGGMISNHSINRSAYMFCLLSRSNLESFGWKPMATNKVSATLSKKKAKLQMS